MLSRIAAVFRPIGWRESVFLVGAWSLSGVAGLLTLFLPSSFGATELALTGFLQQLMPLPLALTTAVLARILTTLLEIAVSVAFFPLLRRWPVLNQSRTETSQTADSAVFEQTWPTPQPPESLPPQS